MDTPYIYNRRGAIATATVAVAATILLLPFIGLTDFNSKGESREAVVALSMLNEGNWILPENNGGDIPYKPPFFHFCVAVASLLGGGVSVFTSRLPSALALIAMVTGCFAFFMRRKGTVVAALAAALLLTFFETHRAGMNCRVDMMLTAFTVGAMLTMYRWHERGARSLPWWGIVCMSGATLTKGPVGFVLPCLAVGVYMLLRGERFWNVVFKLAASGLLACAVPLLWYIAAYQQGGERFLDLVIEENLGRMTGTMSYDSHTHPFTYNFTSLLAGCLPWTLLALFGLLFAPWRRLKGRFRVGNISHNARSLRRKVMSAEPLQVFVWTAFIVVLVFYCLPSSKRSVYLLPCYPFLACLFGELIVWLSRGKRVLALRSFALAVAAIALLLTAAFAAVRMGFVPDGVFTGKHAAENTAMMTALRDVPLTLVRLIITALPVFAAADAVLVCCSRKLRQDSRKVVVAVLLEVFALFLALDGVYQPSVMNTKSMRPMAAVLRQSFPKESLYQHISSPMLHFFGANFYLGDSIGVFEKGCFEGGRKTITTPDTGVLVIPKGDSEAFVKRHTDYKFTLAAELKGYSSEVKGSVLCYRFNRLSTK